jgi:hypothetical protein
MLLPSPKFCKDILTFMKASEVDLALKMPSTFAFATGRQLATTFLI